ncbi:MAG: reverse transcriptase/maturase family protein [Pseudomonadota bacterium]
MAYRQCRLGKAARPQQIGFETRLGSNLLDLHREIHTGRYRPAPSTCFVVTHPKPREIFAAHFRDRIVHHLVVSRLEPLWERRFVFSSFACRVGKGTHGALHYLQAKVRSLSRGGRIPLWVLQLDIASFFVTIHRPTLRNLFLAGVSHPILRKLIETLYSHDARIGVRRKGNPDLFRLIPQEKTWFCHSPDQGLPIGNLTSQFGANVYLNALDHWILRSLRPQAYLRYMDDLLLIDMDPGRLEPMIAPINAWLGTHRGQALNPRKTRLRCLTDGIEYLGYRARQTGLPAQPLQFFAFAKKKWQWIAELRKLERRPFPAADSAHPLSLTHGSRELDRTLAALNSRIGDLVHARTYRLRKASLDRLIHATSAYPGLPDDLGGEQPRLRAKRGYRSITSR